MELTLLYFAALRDLLGRSEEAFSTAETELTVKALETSLLARYPQLTFESVRVAVNEEFVDGSHPLGDGDTVAFIPPVSGG